MVVTTVTISSGLALTVSEDVQVDVARPRVVEMPPPASSPAPAETPTDDSAEATRSAPRKAQRPAFDRTARSTTRAGSLWVVVNKRHGIDPSYEPPLSIVRGHRVATAAATDLTRMLEAADELGLGLKIVSGHRSYARQQEIYQRAVATRGTASADAVSARPGHSEHQTGLAVDVDTTHSPACSLHPCFADTTAGQWVADNAWRHGFVIRYTGTNRVVTGFSHEPWHLRYVGHALAREMRRTGAASLEGFLGVRGGDYVDQP